MANIQENKQIVWNYLLSKGLSEEAAAGVMGNIQQESNFDPENVNKSSGAYGLFQWLGSRKTDLQQYAKEMGKDASNIYVQLDFFWKEMNSTHKSALNALKEPAGRPEDYAYSFEQKFEKSGGSALEKRQTYAALILGEMTGTVWNGSETLELHKAAKAKGVLGLDWWGDVIKVVVIILLLIGGVILFGLSFNFTPNDITKKVVQNGNE